MTRWIIDSVVAAALAVIYAAGFINAVRKGWTR